MFLFLIKAKGSSKYSCPSFFFFFTALNFRFEH